jgi:DnaJ-class molecular chaperone
MGKSAEHAFGWFQALDELTYYDLFGVSPDAPVDDVRSAFHAFCDTFHPDRHITRGDDEREAIGIVFRRGTEAYHVLSDPGLRAQYDEQMRARLTAGAGSTGGVRLSAGSRAPSSSSTAPSHVPLEDSVRSPSARPFARRAEELVNKGDLRQAKLQLVMANHMDPENEALEAALRDVEAKLGSLK